MKRKTLLCIVALVLGLFGTVGALWALLCDQYDRPSPLMDYVPQALGIYDTQYSNPVTDDCRGCHGERAAVAVRHQYAATAFADCPDGCPLDPSQCYTACHEDPTPPGNYGCSGEGCHLDAGATNYPPHHQTDLSGSGQCTTCHRPDLLVEPWTEGLPSYYPTAYSPTPFTCENCHWEAENVSPFIYSNFETHHQGFVGNVASACYACHSTDPQTPNWNPYDPVLIRFCENCHTHDTLHAIHNTDTYGWEAVGFHVPTTNTDCTDVVPTVQRWFTSEDKCIACHGAVPPDAPVLVPQPPAVTGIDPSYGPGGTSCSIAGENFGSSGEVLLTPKMGDTDQTYTITSGNCVLWSSDAIEFNMPSGLDPGNYKMKVRTPDGASNIKVFTLTGTAGCVPCPGALPIIERFEPTVGTADVLFAIHGANFGDRHTADRKICLWVPQPLGEVCIPLPVYSWTDSKVQVRIPAWTFYPDTYMISVETELGESNRDDFLLRFHPSFTAFELDESGPFSLRLSGTGGFGDEQEFVLPDGYGWLSRVRFGTPEETVYACSEHTTSWSDVEIQLEVQCIEPAAYGLAVETMYFYDTNSSGGYDSGDEVYQVVESDVQELEVSGVPPCDDDDGDGVGNCWDNCPADFNPNQEDADSDGLGDVCDACTDTDEDGYGDPGYPPNTCDTDNCPADSNPDQQDADSDGLGDVCDACTDTDGDGYGNPGYPANICPEDGCPDQDSTGFDADGDGCIDSVEGLTDAVDTLVEEGVIDEQMQNSLLSKIDNASNSTSKDNICAAINQLEALINQINAQRGKKIADEAADTLIAYAQSVIDWHLGQLPEGEDC